jgi:acyl-CoA reductase-like NAD-dependent aldehyde dehydrogenase
MSTVDPATGEIIATVPDLGPEEIAEMVARARAAQPAWEALGFEGRGKVLKRAQKWLLDNSDRVIATIISETGKTVEDAQLAEIAYGTAAFGFWAKMAPEYLADQRVRSSSLFVKGRRMVVRYQPLGVIGVIGPWNYPLSNSFGDAIPALAAGNAVILKPSEVTPLTSLLLAEGMRECGLPEDVLQIATGRGDTGAALIDHVDYVMFTGSTATGKKIMERAAQTLTPVSLELGGKDPMIVLEDANLERAANMAVWASMQNSGQTCLSVERVYVQESVYDEFVAKVTDKARAIRQGISNGPGTVEVGSMTFPKQVEIVSAHVKDAVEKGAKVVVGGKEGAGSGHFYEPTVLLDVNHDMECMREETFGPTLPIMKVKDAEEAIRLANDSPYGLAASVFTKDIEKGEAIARRLESGIASVNDALLHYAALELPMGGWKDSGLGRRHGADGIRKYCAQQSLFIARFPLTRELHNFPYTSRMTRLMGRLVRLYYGRGKRD